MLKKNKNKCKQKQLCRKELPGFYKSLFVCVCVCACVCVYVGTHLGYNQRYY